MAHVERKGRNIYIERFILQSLALCGVVTVAVLAPNVIGALKKIDPTWESKINPRLRINQTFYRLVRKGLITREGKGAYKHITLTNKGKKVLIQIDEERFRVRKPFRWDGRWRMVIFDIAERRRDARDSLRRRLRKIGFVSVQGSVWVYPYDCEEIVALIKTNHQLGKQVIYAIVDVMENDSHLRKHFKLRLK